MAKYVKETSRITIKFIDAKTEEIILEVPDRNWMNMSEFFTDHIVTQLIEQKFGNKRIFNDVLVIAVAEFKLVK
jgi:hypothetical protein